MNRKETEIDKCCANCEHSSALYDDDVVLCRKKGVVRSGHSCRKFTYDPLKRKPASPKAPKLEFVNIDL